MRTSTSTVGTAGLMWHRLVSGKAQRRCAAMAMVAIEAMISPTHHEMARPPVGMAGGSCGGGVGARGGAGCGGVVVVVVVLVGGGGPESSGGKDAGPAAGRGDGGRGDGGDGGEDGDSGATPKVFGVVSGAGGDGGCGGERGVEALCSPPPESSSSGGVIEALALKARRVGPPAGTVAL
eukprot:5599307-Prymnesium_polylepis.1